jgi:hypothetical protein
MLDHETQDPRLANKMGASGGLWGHPVDPIEAALAGALTGATAAGQWQLVGELARQLADRKLEREQTADREPAPVLRIRQS